MFLFRFCSSSAPHSGPEGRTQAFFLFIAIPQLPAVTSQWVKLLAVWGAAALPTAAPHQMPRQHLWWQQAFTHSRTHAVLARQTFPRQRIWKNSEGIKAVIAMTWAHHSKFIGIQVGSPRQLQDLPPLKATDYTESQLRLGRGSEAWWLLVLRCSLTVLGGKHSLLNVACFFAS